MTACSLGSTASRRCAGSTSPRGTTATMRHHRGRGLEGAGGLQEEASPPSSRKALGRDAPIRSPRPAATRMARAVILPATTSEATAQSKG